MPILNATLGGQAVDAQGNQKPMSPADALIHRGPIVQVTLSVAPAVAQPILTSGGKLPNPVVGWALIDTGASGTCIDDEAAVALSLPVTGSASMASATDAQSLRNLYPVEFEVQGWQIKFNSNRVMGANLKPQGLVALIGRDILSRCVLVYNGATGGFSLAI